MCSSRKTCAPFSPEEAGKIRDAIVAPGARIACPRCGGDLITGTPIAGGGSIVAVWELRCENCQRTLIVRELPVGSEAQAREGLDAKRGQP